MNGWLTWTRDFIRDFGWGGYWRVVIRDAWRYRLANWRCSLLGHDFVHGPDEREMGYLIAQHIEFRRSKCEFYVETWHYGGRREVPRRFWRIRRAVRAAA